MEPKTASAPPPAYDQAVHGESSGGQYSSSSGGVYGPGLQGPDRAYLRSLGGISKIVQAVTCLIAFIIDLTVYYPGSGFTSFSTINGFIQALIWFILRLLHAIPQILANYYIEMIMCGIITLFLFISFIITAVYGWMAPGIAAACFFCFVAMIAYGIDLGFQIVEIRRKFAGRRDGQSAPVVD